MAKRVYGSFLPTRWLTLLGCWILARRNMRRTTGLKEYPILVSMDPCCAICLLGGKVRTLTPRAASLIWRMQDATSCSFCNSREADVVLMIDR